MPKTAAANRTSAHKTSPHDTKPRNSAPRLARDAGSYHKNIAIQDEYQINFPLMVKFELSESQVEREVLDYCVKIRNLLAWKNVTGGFFDTSKKRFRKHASPYARNGVSDIIVVLHGHFIAFEIKTRVGRQSESQKTFERDLRSAGGSYFIIRSIEDCIDALDEIESKFEKSMNPV